MNRRGGCFRFGWLMVTSIGRLVIAGGTGVCVNSQAVMNFPDSGHRLGETDSAFFVGLRWNGATQRDIGLFYLHQYVAKRSVCAELLVDLLLKIVICSGTLALTFGIYMIACALLFRALIISGLLLCNRSILTEVPGLRKGTGNSERCGKSQSEMESVHTDSPSGVQIRCLGGQKEYIPPPATAKAALA